MNIEGIRKDYESGILTLKAIQTKYGISYYDLKAIIKARQWNCLAGSRLCLNEKQIRELKKEFKERVSVDKLVEKYGISRSYVYQLCKPAKVPIEKIRMNAWQDRQAGMSIFDIAFKYDRSETTIRSWIDKINRECTF